MRGVLGVMEVALRVAYDMTNDCDKMYSAEYLYIETKYDVMHLNI